LRKVGVWPIEHISNQQSGIPKQLTDMTFAITGAIEGFTRDELKEIIQQHGGKVTDSVSKNTNYLLVGEQPGSKLDKAQKLSVKIIDIKAFNKLIE
jgi:DNA ligase (NAD+)